MEEREETWTTQLASRGIVPGAIVRDRYLEGTVMRVTRIDEEKRRVHLVYRYTGAEGYYNEEQVSRYLVLADEPALATGSAVTP